MAHVCNPSYLGGRDRRIRVEAIPGKKLMRNPSPPLPISKKQASVVVFAYIPGCLGDRDKIGD
jgi:hypothetical protein